jgi:hypothetical protein
MPMSFKTAVSAALAFFFVSNSIFANTVRFVRPDVAVIIAVFFISISIFAFIYYTKRRHIERSTSLTVLLILLFSNGFIIISLLTNSLKFTTEDTHYLEIAVIVTFCLSILVGALTYVNRKQ